VRRGRERDGRARKGVGESAEIPYGPRRGAPRCTVETVMTKMGLSVVGFAPKSPSTTIRAKKGPDR